MPRTRSEAEIKAATRHALQHSRYARARIEHIVRAAPPLSAEQRAELAPILLDADTPPPPAAERARTAGGQPSC